MNGFESTKVIELGSCAFRQWRANHSHCRFLHGYRLTAKIWLTASTLDERNWVFDFGDFKDLQTELKATFDHTTVVAGDDPAMEVFIELNEKGIIQLVCLKDGVGVEKFAKHVYDRVNSYVSERTDGRVSCQQVEVFEHENNSAISFRPTALEESFDPKDDIPMETPTPPVSDQPPGKQPETPPAGPDPHAPRPANVGQSPTTGKGNWFAGTTWE